MSSCDVSVDNMLSCEESPLYFPNGMSVDSVHHCKTCTLRLVSKLPGPGNVLYGSGYALVLNENPNNSLIVNGTMYNVVSTVLIFKGLHRLPGRTVVSPAELCLMMNQSQGRSKDVVCLCIPVETGASNPYFSTLSNVVTANRPTLGTLLSDTATFLSYRGPSLVERTKTNPRPRNRCDPIQDIVTYYISLTPTTMDINDYQRLFAMLPTDKNVGPPEPIGEITRERTKLLTRIEGIELESKGLVQNSGRGYSPEALKCYRLDTKRDVVGNTIYINGNGKPGQTTLTAEMAAAAAGETIHVKDDCKDVSWSQDIKTWPVSYDDIEQLMKDPKYKESSTNGVFLDKDKLKAICAKDDNCKGIFAFREGQPQTMYLPVHTAGVEGTPTFLTRDVDSFEIHTISNKIPCARPIVHPGDIERLLGTILGLVFGFIVCALIAYYVLWWTNSNYLNVLKLYGTTPVKTVTVLQNSFTLG